VNLAHEKKWDKHGNRYIDGWYATVQTERPGIVNLAMTGYDDGQRYFAIFGTEGSAKREAVNFARKLGPPLCPYTIEKVKSIKGLKSFYVRKSKQKRLRPRFFENMLPRKPRIGDMVADGPGAKVSIRCRDGWRVLGTGELILRKQVLTR
jgi:hypothetical protein